MVHKHSEDCLRKHSALMIISTEKAEKMRKILKGEIAGIESETTEFQDGATITVECRSEQPEDDDREGYPAASAVIVTPDKKIKYRTPPFQSFWNEWRIDINDTSYRLNVKPE